MARGHDTEAPRMRGTTPRFTYTPRDPGTVQKRATQSGLDYDTFIDPRFPKFTSETGLNCVRILPPGWETPEHFGFDYYLHSQVGPDNSQYLCLEKMSELAKLHGVEGAGRCPVCEERKVLEREGNTEEANVLKASHRIGVWIIDRNNEKDGPKFWDMSWTMDKDIASLQINKRTGDALLIDDPDTGYDFEFVREGKGLNTRYIGKQISRQESPVSDDPKLMDAWLAFISEHPIPDVLNFYSYEHITKVFSGRVVEAEPEPERTARRITRQDDDAPAPRSRAHIKPEPKVEEEEDVELPFEKADPRSRGRLAKGDVEVEEEEEIEDQPSGNGRDTSEKDPIPRNMRERLTAMNDRNTRR